MIRIATNIKDRYRSFSIIKIEKRYYFIGRVEFDGIFCKANAFRLNIYHLIFIPVWIYYKLRHGTNVD